MRGSPILAVVAALTLASACEQATEPTHTVAPSLAISDAAHNGNPRVFFLPPMVPDASAGFTDGAFVGDLDVVVKVCIWNTTLNACSSPVLETYDRNSGPGSEKVRVPEGAEYYLVNWHSDNILDQYTLGAFPNMPIVTQSVPVNGATMFTG